MPPSAAAVTAPCSRNDDARSSGRPGPGPDRRLHSIAAMRRFSIRAVALLAAVAAPALGACSSDDEDATPAACLAPASDYLDALTGAPAEVLIGGETPISGCLVAGQSPAELADAGESMIGAATELNAAARRDPGGDDTVRLGYLVGAVQRGAAETGGIHADLVRRLDAAARFVPEGERLPVSFERAFGEGYAAGQATG